VAEAYLKGLYSEEAQEMAARRGYRPRSAKVAEKYAAKFPKLTLFTVDQVFGGWAKAQATHFDEGGTFDQLYRPGR
jgi:ABC-type sulfate transport system substrate-binding protein